MLKESCCQRKAQEFVRLVYFCLTLFASLLFSPRVLAQVDTRLFVPIILPSSGENGSFFTSELTLTNRGATEVNWTTPILPLLAEEVDKPQTRCQLGNNGSSLMQSRTSNR